MRDSRYKRVYGITLEQYNELLEKQNHRCAICNRHTSELKRRLAVEHDHGTKRIMGLCCDYCNRIVLGRVRDPEIFKKAAEYLAGPGTEWFVPNKKKRKKKKSGKPSRNT